MFNQPQLTVFPQYHQMSYASLEQALLNQHLNNLANQLAMNQPRMGFMRFPAPWIQMNTPQANTSALQNLNPLIMDSRKYFSPPQILNQMSQQLSDQSMREQMLLRETTSQNQKQTLLHQQENNNDLHISEILTKTRRKELENALKKASADSDVIIHSRLKRKQSKSSRGSQFRGVSKNGKKWQVQLLGNLKKHYIGSINTEQRAARIYDKHAILTHGLRAKTNFSYSKTQILAIVEKEDEDPINDESDESQQKQVIVEADLALEQMIQTKISESQASPIIQEESIYDPLKHEELNSCLNNLISQ